MSYLFTFPYWQTQAELLIVIVSQILATFFFIISVVKSPGHIKPN